MYDVAAARLVTEWLKAKRGGINYHLSALPPVPGEPNIRPPRLVRSHFEYDSLLEKGEIEDLFPQVIVGPAGPYEADLSNPVPIRTGRITLGVMVIDRDAKASLAVARVSQLMRAVERSLHQLLTDGRGVDTTPWCTDPSGIQILARGDQLPEIDPPGHAGLNVPDAYNGLIRLQLEVRDTVPLPTGEP